MKNLAKANHRTLPLVTTAVLSLALTLPMLANQAVADNREQTTAWDTGRDTRTDFLRFPAAGRAEQNMTVTWADLNLGHPQGIEQLYLRLSQATADVCSPRPDIRNAAMNRDYKACRETAMDSAVSNVGHLGLEEMHASRTGRSVKPGQEIAER